MFVLSTFFRWLPKKLTGDFFGGIRFVEFVFILLINNVKNKKIKINFL